MNARKARAARRAQERSQAATATRLQKKARRVAKTESEREFEHELGVAKRERDKALEAANIAYLAAMNVAEQERARARKKTYAAYDERRDELVKRFAAQEAEAA